MNYCYFTFIKSPFIRSFIPRSITTNISNLDFCIICRAININPFLRKDTRQTTLRFFVCILRSRRHQYIKFLPIISTKGNVTNKFIIPSVFAFYVICSNRGNMNILNLTINTQSTSNRRFPRNTTFIKFRNCKSIIGSRHILRASQSRSIKICFTIPIRINFAIFSFWIAINISMSIFNKSI